MVPEYDEQEPRKKNDKKEDISMRQFWRYRTYFRKEFVDAQNSKSKQNHWLWSMRKLAEYFIISVENRIEQNEMNWTKLSQDGLREILAIDFIKAIEKGLPEVGKLGKVFISPRTFAGSRLYYQSSYADLMTMVRCYGNPTWYFRIILYFIFSYIHIYIGS
jgi:hypothetical protein